MNRVRFALEHLDSTNWLSINASVFVFAASLVRQLNVLASNLLHTERS